MFLFSDFTGLRVLTAICACAVATEPQLVDTVLPYGSLEAYLKATEQPSDEASCRALFTECFQDEKYKGNDAQKARLLGALVLKNSEAIKCAKDAANDSVLAMEDLQTSSPVRDWYLCPGWVPAKDFGVNGSYGFTVNVVPRNGEISGRNFVVCLSTNAVIHGPASFTGTVTIIHERDNKQTQVQTFELQEAWFPTIGPAGSKAVFRYAKEGTIISLPDQTKVWAEIELHPSIKTSSGPVVGLWGCKRKMLLNP